MICFLLLHFSVQCYLLQLNLIIFQGNLKKKVKLLIQIMLITFAAPHPNDPNVYGDWPWTNGGNTVGGSHNNGIFLHQYNADFFLLP